MGQGSYRYMPNEVEKWKGKEASWAWGREATPICPKRWKSGRERKQVGQGIGKLIVYAQKGKKKAEKISVLGI